MLRSALLVLVLLLVPAAPAAAQVVAGTPPGLTARTEGGKLAVTLTVPGAEPVTETGPTPRWLDEVVMATVFKDGEVYVGGAVSAAAASVEIGFERDQLIRVPVTAGFFVGQVTSIDTDDNPNSIRSFDAAGALLGVADSPEESRSAEILRRGRVRFRAEVTSQLDPVALAPEHRSERLCLFIRVAHGDGEELTCREQPEVVSLAGYVGCGRTPTTLAGFVPARTRRLDLLLGSGRTVRVTPRTAPLGQPGAIALAVLPRGEAIRRATARDATGRVLDRATLQVAPPFRRCTRPLERWTGQGDGRPPRLGRPPGAQLASALASDGGPQLLARDEGDRLCVGLDALDRDGGDCFLPRFSGRSSAFTIEQGAVIGVVPAQVAAVEIFFVGGGHIIAPALPGIDYSGRYRDVVNFVLAPLPIGKRVNDGRALDAAEHEIGFVSVRSPD